MAKPKSDPVKSEKHLAWLAAEAKRIELQSALDAANDEAARTASEFGEELKQSGKNAAQGPGDAAYIVQACRKAKGSDEPPKYPYTMRKAQTLLM